MSTGILCSESVHTARKYAEPRGLESNNIYYHMKNHRAALQSINNMSSLSVVAVVLLLSFDWFPFNAVCGPCGFRATFWVIILWWVLNCQNCALFIFCVFQSRHCCECQPSYQCWLEVQQKIRQMNRNTQSALRCTFLRMQIRIPDGVINTDETDSTGSDMCINPCRARLLDTERTLSNVINTSTCVCAFFVYASIRTWMRMSWCRSARKNKHFSSRRVMLSTQKPLASETRRG